MKRVLVSPSSTAPTNLGIDAASSHGPGVITLSVTFRVRQCCRPLPHHRTRPGRAPAEYRHSGEPRRGASFADRCRHARPVLARCLELFGGGTFFGLSMPGLDQRLDQQVVHTDTGDSADERADDGNPPVAAEPPERAGESNGAPAFEV